MSDTAFCCRRSANAWRCCLWKSPARWLET